MEHIIQIGIGIDDDAIVERATDYAAKQIAKDIEKETFRIGYGGNHLGFSDHFEELVKDTINGYKEEIIQRATEMVVRSITKSKQYKAFIATLGEKKDG